MTEKKEYLKIGERKYANENERLLKRGYYDNGLDYGYIFKDEEAYEKDWDEVCYVPEAEWDYSKPDEEGFYPEITGDTHNTLLALCFGNREWCDSLFDRCRWACAETYIQEESDNDTAYFYRFIKPGTKVWWNDPAGETSGVYEVFGVPFEFDDHGELIEPDSFSLDESIILIGTEYSEVEVTPNELTPVYPDLINQ